MKKNKQVDKKEAVNILEDVQKTLLVNKNWKEEGLKIITEYKEELKNKIESEE